MTICSVTVIIIFGYSNVYFLPSDRRLEFFNEATILLCVYHCFLFTDYVPLPEDRFFMGYSMIASTVLNFSVNGGLLIINSIKLLVKQYKTTRKKYRFWKHKRSEEFML